jgi:glycosyltransferase involved in cell wall biosynthesis
MRILVLSWEFPPYVVGGMGKHVAGLVPALGNVLSSNGACHVDVVTTRYAGGMPVEHVVPGVTVHRVEVAPFDPADLYNTVIANNDALVHYAEQLIGRTSYELIHVHDWLPAVAGIILKLRYKIPLIATIHATERGRYQGNLTSTVSRQIDALEWRLCFEAWSVIVCSHFMTTELHTYFDVPFDKIVVLPNGIDPAQLHHCTPEQRAALRAYYAPDGERLLFFVGRIVHEKGLHVLIRALPAIVREFPDTRLLVAGRNSRHLLPLAAELGVNGAVRFLDFITDEQRDALYQVVDAAIFPSLYEPFGIVALEAMALDCNVIASDVGGLGEVVQHMVNGLTVYANDPQSIAWAVRELFRNPYPAATRRVTALRQVQELYNWPAIAQRTADFYRTIIDQRRATDW